MNKSLTLCFVFLFNVAAIAADAASLSAQRQAAAQAQMKDEQRLQATARDRQVREKRSAKLQAAGVPRKEADEAAKTEAGYQARLKAASKQRAPKKKSPSTTPQG
jgi:hypothetical protein